MSQPRIAAVILAAGKGTRLKSDLPKVLHEVCGRPMLAYVFDACRAAGIDECIAVVGHMKDAVIDAFNGDEAITWIEQNPQHGTGHAVMVCRAALQQYDHVLVLCGDGPLIRPETIREVVGEHREGGHGATLATAVLDDPARYGRIWRSETGAFLGIVEYVDATEEQRAIREVNPSYYCFATAALLPALDQLTNDNAKGEYYITDTFALMREAGHTVGAITSVPPEDIYSINSRQDLARVNRVMRDRVLDRHMTAGVTIVDPSSTWIDDRATIGSDTIIYPHVHIAGPLKIGTHCRIGPLVHLSGNRPVAHHTTIAPLTGARP